MDREELLRRYAAHKRDFSEFNLSHINLSGTYLKNINLTGADLTGAKVLEHDLWWLTFFHNTTMPNGEVIVEPRGNWD